MGEFSGVRPVDAVIFQQIGKRMGIGHIVYGRNLQMRIFFEETEESSSYPAKAVDSYINGSHVRIIPDSGAVKSVSQVLVYMFVRFVGRADKGPAFYMPETHPEAGFLI